GSFLERRGGVGAGLFADHWCGLVVVLRQTLRALLSAARSEAPLLHDRGIPRGVGAQLEDRIVTVTPDQTVLVALQGLFDRRQRGVQLELGFAGYQVLGAVSAATQRVEVLAIRQVCTDVLGGGDGSVLGD